MEGYRANYEYESKGEQVMSRNPQSLCDCSPNSRIDAGACTLIVRHKMKPHLMLLLCLLLTECVSPPNPCSQIIKQASAITHYPIHRSELIDQLGLQGVASKRSSGTSRRGPWYSEQWNLSNGCKLWADDFEPMKEITREDIDRILNDPNRQTSSLEPRGSFVRIRIEDQRGATVFDSTTVQ